MFAPFMYVINNSLLIYVIVSGLVDSSVGNSDFNILILHLAKNANTSVLKLNNFRFIKDFAFKFCILLLEEHLRMMTR